MHREKGLFLSVYVDDIKLAGKKQNIDHEKIETGAVVKSHKGLSGVEEKGQCSKGDQCSFRHESNDRAQKPEHKAATPSKTSMSRC